MANACSLFQDGGPHENDCTTSGNDATAITGDDAIFCDRFSHFLSLYLSLQRIKNKGADQLANFSTLIVCFLDSIIPMVSLFNVNHVLYSAGWFESLISQKQDGFLATLLSLLLKYCTPE